MQRLSIKHAVIFAFFLLVLLPFLSFAQKKVVNLYTWTGEVPDSVIRQFEKETGIKVNLSTYENNEIMYAKLRATKSPGYDIVIPSSYFVDRMRKQNMLQPLDKAKIPNWKNLGKEFLHKAYDPQSDYCVPYLWGITGIFYNEKYHHEAKLQKWSDLWNKSFHDQLLLLNDSREIFSIAFLSLGYPANDQDPVHIKQAFLKLKALMQNVKVFSSDTVVSIMIDEDATLGSAWNGDAYKASLENPHIKFVYPKDGFVIWVDNLAVPKNALHLDNAYAFINFLLRPDIGKTVALETRYPTTNAAAEHLLPAKVRLDPMAYPPKASLKHGQFQTDLSDDTLALYEKYWEELKMS